MFKEKILSRFKAKHIKILLGVIAFFLICFIYVVVSAVLLLGEVGRVKDEYVSIKVSGDKVNYTLTKSRPSQWVSLESIESTVAAPIVISEDWAFYDHHGIDFSQLWTAIKDIVTGKRSRGASTITQQLIKNLFLSHEKSLLRKGKELILAVYLDLSVSKNKILETYLNIIEYAPATYGIFDASLYYFSKSPDLLNVKEGAFLAMLLPNPKKYNTSFKTKMLTPYASKTMIVILRKLVMARLLSREQYDYYVDRSFSWEKQTLKDPWEDLDLNETTQQTEVDLVDWQENFQDEFIDYDESEDMILEELEDDDAYLNAL